MMTQSLHRRTGRGVIYGAIGGFVGGHVMYSIMSGVMLAIGMGANCFAVIIALITGQPYSNGLIPLGVAVHLITSTVIGAIFGVIIGSVNKLRITGFGRGFGVATGLIAFVVTNRYDYYATRLLLSILNRLTIYSFYLEQLLACYSIV